MDAADGEPRDSHVLRRPANIVQRHRLGGGLGAGRKHRPDGDVIRSGGKGALSLRGRMGGQANAECGVRSAECGNIFETGVKKIFLSQVTKLRAEVARDFQMVVDDEADVRAARDGQNFFSHGADFIGRGFFGAKLDQIAAAVAELLRDEFGRAAVQVGRVHESVELAIRERFHKNSLIIIGKAPGRAGSAMSSARSFSARVMAAECHRQMLFATFFSTRDFCERKQFPSS